MRTLLPDRPKGSGWSLLGWILLLTCAGMLYGKSHDPQCRDVSRAQCITKFLAGALEPDFAQLKPSDQRKQSRILLSELIFNLRATESQKGNSMERLVSYTTPSSVESSGSVSTSPTRVTSVQSQSLPANGAVPSKPDVFSATNSIERPVSHETPSSAVSSGSVSTSPTLVASIQTRSFPAINAIPSKPNVLPASNSIEGPVSDSATAESSGSASASPTLVASVQMQSLPGIGAVRSKPDIVPAIKIHKTVLAKRKIKFPKKKVALTPAAVVTDQSRNFSHLYAERGHNAAWTPDW